jgi:hypothetical protein
LKKAKISATLLGIVIVMWHSNTDAQQVFNADTTTHRTIMNTKFITVFGGIQLANKGRKNDISPSEDSPYIGLTINIPISQNWKLPGEFFLWNIKQADKKEKQWLPRLSVSIKYEFYQSDQIIIYTQAGTGIFFALVPQFINFGIGMEKRLSQSLNFVFDIRMIGVPFGPVTAIAPPILAVGLNFI